MPGRKEWRSSKPWRAPNDPARILLIRLHAIGDVALMLPAAAGLRRQLPNATIDILSTAEPSGLLEAYTMFNRVIAAPAARNPWQRMKNSIERAVLSGEERYDVIIDLQRNWSTRLQRRLLRPRAWSEFDRFGPRSASERTLETFHRAGFEGLVPAFRPAIRHDIRDSARSLLLANGWDGATPLIVLNPAGLWITRNWPVANYVTLARIWLERGAVQFLLIGTSERLGEAGRYFRAQLGDAAINLVGRTSLAEAAGILLYVTAVVSEDSGLLHLAWASGLPSLAILGSSNHAWVAPSGMHGGSLDSRDLPCGACMQPECRYGDVHCLTRFTPERVLDSALSLMSRCSHTVRLP